MKLYLYKDEEEHLRVPKAVDVIAVQVTDWKTAAEAVCDACDEYNEDVFEIPIYCNDTWFGRLKNYRGTF